MSILISHSPTFPFPPFPCPHVCSLFLFLPCKQVHLFRFSRFHIYALIYDICFSLSLPCNSAPIKMYKFSKDIYRNVYNSTISFVFFLSFSFFFLTKLNKLSKSLFILISLNLIFILYWSTVDLQHSVSFRCTAK